MWITYPQIINILTIVFNRCFEVVLQIKFDYVASSAQMRIVRKDDSVFTDRSIVKIHDTSRSSISKILYRLQKMGEIYL
jgi:hypothetical protein